jgi:hypothetical protein
MDTRGEEKMRTILETTVALLSLAGAVTWASAASAQTTTTTTDEQGRSTQTTTAVPAPAAAPAAPSAQIVNIQQPAAQPVSTTTTTAAPVYVQTQPAQPASETVDTGESVPNKYLIWTGVALLGISWGASAIVSAESQHQGDGHLWVPLAGPWLDFVDRGAMPADSHGHDVEVTNRVFLAVDGVVQAVGALEIISGFVFPTTRYETRTTNTEASARKVDFRLTPMKLSKNGYGFGAIGTF